MSASDEPPSDCAHDGPCELELRGCVLENFRPRSSWIIVWTPLQTLRACPDCGGVLRVRHVEDGWCETLQLLKRIAREAQIARYRTVFADYVSKLEVA